MSLKKVIPLALDAIGCEISEKVNLEKYTTLIDHAVNIAMTTLPIKKSFLKFVE